MVEKEEVKLMPGIYDCIFKSIMLTEKNIDYLREVIHMITGIPIENLSNIIVKNIEHIVRNKTDKKLRSDIIVSIGNHIINLEMNKKYYVGLFSRNEEYFNKIASSLYIEKDSFKEERYVIQINFDNFNYFHGNKNIYKFILKEETLNIVYPNSIIKYHIDLDFIKKKWYDKKNIENATKLERYMLMLVAETDKVACKFVGDDKILENIREHLNDLNSDLFVAGLYDAEKEQEKIMNTQILYAEEQGMKQGIEKGIEKGIQEGTKQSKIEIAKNMINKNFDKHIISEITNLSIKEIEDLK